MTAVCTTCHKVWNNTCIRVALVKALLKECFERAKKLLLDNKEALAKIADYLYEKETITGKQFMEIFDEIRGVKKEAEDEAKSEEKAELKVTQEKDESSVGENASKKSE